MRSITNQLTVFFLIAVVAGCGGSQTSVKGTVTFDDQPIERGSLSLVPLSGGPNVGSMIKDGEYQVESLAPGKYRAEIMGVEAGPVVTSSAELERMAASNEQITEPRQIGEKAVGSGVEIEIVSGAQERDFDLRSGP